MAPIDHLRLFITTDMPGVVDDLLGPHAGQRRSFVDDISRPYGPSERRGGRQPANNGSDQ